MLAEHSLFVSLHKWARQQDENYCTEGLIYLLRLMLRETPAQALGVIGWLTDGLIGAGILPQTISISSQVTGEDGRPDIEIIAESKTAIIEVKVDSKVEATQLKRYRTRLEGKIGERRLILLSRGNDKLHPDNLPDCIRRWLDLSLRLRGTLEALPERPSKMSVILEDYLTFLGTKQMSLEVVSVLASRSVSDVASILTQLKLAIEQFGGDAKRGWSEKDAALGYNIKIGGETVGWVGFNLYYPQWLFYSTEGAKDESKIDLTLADTHGLPTASVEGKHWTNSIDLVDCREYLNASAANQVEFLRRHIEASLFAFRAMIVPPVKV